MMTSMFRQELSQVPIFCGLDEIQLEFLDPFVELCHFSKGQVIFDQGQAATFMYILRLGEVIIQYKPYDAPLLTVARIEPSGVFGWSAALGRVEYTSAAIAAVNSEAYQLRGEGLSRICAQYPETGVVILGRLASVIAERLQSTHTQILSMLNQGLHGDCEKRNGANGKK
jgi:CRP/FNR family transcriptional regulator, cyclic AMP receptor protein